MTLKRPAVKSHWSTIALTTLILLGSFAAISSDAQAAESYYTTSAGLNIPDFGANPTVTSVAGCTASQPCLWSNPATWSTGAVPATGDIVVISSGTVVTYDVDDSTNSIALNTVEAKGVLTFSTTANTQMFVGTLEVPPGGELDIGTNANPIPANITANIVWINQPINVSATQQLTLASGTTTLSSVSTLPSTTVLDPEQYGLGLIGLGTVNIYGAVKSPYVTLATEPKAGDTTLTLAAPTTGWQVGDKLQLPDTRQLLGDSATGYTYTPEWEPLTIQSISTDGLTITLTAPLLYNHLGAHDLNGVLNYLPHVVDTTRNVSIHSQSATGTRGYALFSGRANVDIENTAFGGMGRTSDNAISSTAFSSNGQVAHIGTNEQNRNPITFLNLVGPANPQANGYQFTFAGNVVQCPLSPMPYIWGVNVVNSFYGLIQGNDVVNWDGAGIEVDGTSSYNMFNQNFVMRISGTSGRLDQGLQGDGFWFHNPNNYITNNIATDINPDGMYSFGFDIDASTGGSFGVVGTVTIPAIQGADPSEVGQSVQINMNDTPILEFSGNEAYGATPAGMTDWCIGTLPNQFYTDAKASVIKNLVIWHTNWGFFGYQSNNMTLDGLVIEGDPANLDNGYQSVEIWGLFFYDYLTHNITVENSTIEGMQTGIRTPYYVGQSDLNPGTSMDITTIENSHLNNVNNIDISPPRNVGGSPSTMLPQTIDINSVEFTNPTKVLYPEVGANYNVNMDYMTATDASGTPNLSVAQYVNVTNYNGISGDNFQVCYNKSPSPTDNPAGSGTPGCGGSTATMPLVAGYVSTNSGGGSASVAPSGVTATCTPASGTAPLSVSCTGSASGTPAPTLAWSSTDGTSGSGASFSDNIATAGNYTITLTATNSAGSATSTQAITATNPQSTVIAPSNVSISGLTANCTAPCTENLNAVVGSGTTPFTYSWVGNNATGSSATFSTTISSAGSYPITLAVSNSGGTASASGTVTVIAPVVTPANPVASASVTSGVAPLAINFSTTNGTGGTAPYSYAWTFGDGSSSTSQNPSHTYAAAGTYTAYVTVSDSAGGTKSNSLTVTVSAPVVAPVNPVVSVSVTSGTAPLAVDFSTTNGSGGTAPYTYAWTFGDGGTSTSQNPSHTYSAAGTYTASVTVSDSAGGTKSNSVTVTVSAPVIAPANPVASASVTSGVAPLAVSFSTTNGTGGTAPYTYAWSFGDGSTSTSQNPSHTYAAAGTYTAYVTVSDSAGGTKSNSVTVTVAAPAPSLAVGISDTAASGNAWLKERFSVNVTGATGSRTWYHWDFGDGHTSTYATPAHLYKTPGTYTVTLKIYNNKQTATASTTITVNPPLAPTASPIATEVNDRRHVVKFEANATAAAGAELTRHQWNFGDGATGWGANAWHHYATPGTYNATLTITDNDGGSATFPITVTVK